MSVFIGDMFIGATVLGDDDLHYYLEHDDCPIADIVMPKKKMAGAILEEGAKVNVIVTKICIANDGTPGAFVKLHNIHV